VSTVSRSARPSSHAPGPATAPTRSAGGASSTAGSRSSPDEKHASNVNIPSELITPVKVECAKKNLTYGELIIKAIASTKEDLADLIAPRDVVGDGELFDERPAYRSTTDGPKSPLPFSMRIKDFDDLDRHVTRFKAGSRTRLIQVALAAYLATDS
jgi:hypothetical protein